MIPRGPGLPGRVREGAFLRALPGLDAPGYARLVRGDEGAGADVAALAGPSPSRPVPDAVTGTCGRCHGLDGRGRGTAAFPRLDGQRPAYLLASLQAFARGERHSGIMGPIAAALAPEDMRDLADYYASVARGARQRSRDHGGAALVPESSLSRVETPALLEMGEAIAQTGILAQRVPPCAACHGPGAEPRNPIYADLAGQYADYLALQLTLFGKNARGGTAYAHIMRMVAGRLTPAQIRAVAAYYASLAPLIDPPGR